jgi:hypothetical protein
LTNVILPLGVISLDYEAFAYCTGLTSITIPNSVTSIGDAAFYSCSSLTSITIPASVTNISNEAFESCVRLAALFFQGNAPSDGDCAFCNGIHPTAYYLPGTTGWDTFSDLQTSPWVLPRPLILNTSPGFGVKTNRFGFIISWATNVHVVVEASTDLTSHNWVPVSTNTLTRGSSYFGDPEWTNHRTRFYRLRSP